MPGKGRKGKSSEVSLLLQGAGEALEGCPGLAVGNMTRSWDTLVLSLFDTEQNEGAHPILQMKTGKLAWPGTYPLTEPVNRGAGTPPLVF